MTNDELRIWQRTFATEIMGGQKSAFVSGVVFRFQSYGGITYSFKNAGGCVFAYSQFNGKDNHVPKCQVSPFYSKLSKFHITTNPDLESIAAGVKVSWEKFISNK